MKRRLIYLSFALIVLAAVFACPNKAQAGILQVTQNTANESIDLYPEMDDNGRVAWVQTDAQGSKNLYLNDTQQIQKLSSTSDSIQHLTIGNGKVAWIQYNSSTQTSEIWLYDGQKNQKISSAAGPIYNFAMENGEIAWVQYEPSGIGDIFIYDGQKIQKIFSTSEATDQVSSLIMQNGKIAWTQHDYVTRISKSCYYDGQQVYELVSSTDDISPGISMENGGIYWVQENSTTGEFSIWFYNGQNIQELPFTSTEDFINPFAVENGKIAWRQENTTVQPLPPYRYDICFYDGQQVHILASGTDFISGFAMGNGKIAWTQYNPNNKCRVYLYNGQAVQELKNATTAGVAGFCNGQLVWRQGIDSDDKNYHFSDSEICIYDGQNIQTIAGAGNGDPYYLQVVNGRILYKSPDNQLFIYTVNPPDTQEVTNFVTRFYSLCLNRQPDTVGLNYWVNALATGQQSGADVSQNFILSTEFMARGLSDSDFLDIMYSAFFNRSADSGGKAYWQSQRDNGMSRLFILASFVNSPEFASICSNYGITRGSITLTDPADLNPPVTAFVNRFYVLCLERKADSVGLNYWVDQLVTGAQTGADLSQGFIFSPEFEAQALNNTDFLAVMYRAFFNREPDSGGLEYWAGQMAGGMSRLGVLANFVNSAEFAALCSEYGIEPGDIGI